MDAPILTGHPVSATLALWMSHHGLLCNFVAVFLTIVQFILQLKLRLYTIVHLLLKKD